ncbi:hypothetical protein [Sphingobium sp.]|uniref:hypothetical protein n=1 Tax=Sphingobium sp. TaxID=1912891 RepID=UPI0026252D1A|nr:hypothetical protein [Sphingobium sp.]
MASDDTRQAEAPAFRSDNDLHQWRFEWGMVAAVTTGTFAAMANIDLPLRYWPLALLPPIGMLIFSRWTACRNRRQGKRFSHYDDDRLSR